MIYLPSHVVPKLYDFSFFGDTKADFIEYRLQWNDNKLEGWKGQLS